MAPDDRSMTKKFTEAIFGRTRRLNDPDTTLTRPIRTSANADTVDLNEAWIDPAPDAIPNLDKRVLLMLLLDTSNSMSIPLSDQSDLTPISQLNAGLQSLKQALMDDGDARRRVEVGMVTFGGTPTLRNLRPSDDTTPAAGEAFVPADQFSPPVLRASGLTPMAAGLRQALHAIDARKKVLKDRRIPYYRPWIMLISDGAPTDDNAEWDRAVQEVQQAQQAQRVVLFPIGVENADMSRLEHLIWNDPADPDSHVQAMKLQGLRFQDLFLWLSASIQQTLTSSHDNPREALAKRDKWAQMNVS